jgi:hypothetical protein
MAIKRSPKATAFTSDILGSSGLNSTGGFISDERLAILSGITGLHTYRKMADNDPVVGAALYAIRMLLRGAEWTVQAAGEDAESEMAKEFVEGVLNDMTFSWGTVVDEICSMFTYGFAPLEIIWKRRGGIDAPDGSSRSTFDDGLIGIRALSLRRQDSVYKWEIDPNDDSIDGMWQNAPAKPPVFIPIEKLLLFRVTEEANNPQGRSILRNAYRPWFMKTRIEDIEGVGIERDLAGLPLARIPSVYFDASASPDEKAVLAMWKQLVTRVRRDQQEGLLLPSDRDDKGNLLFDFQLLSAAGARSFDTNATIDRHGKAIAMSILADFIFLGQTAVGSFALSSDKTALFASAVGGFASAIADVFNRHLLPRLWRLNAMDFAVMPKLVPGDIETPSLEALGAFITSLSGSGAMLFPDRELENSLRAKAGLPPAPESGGEDEVETPAPPGTDDNGRPEE